MKIAVVSETHPSESRCAQTPDGVRKLVGEGHVVTIVKGAGAQAAFSDDAYAEAGATLAGDNKAAVRDADLIMCVRRPASDIVAAMKSGAVTVGLFEPSDRREEFAAFAKAGVSAMAMEFTPRITRAQSMDALSSQANLAGYRAIIEASHAYGRAMPMMMTAAGTIAPAKTFVMGAGVAGLQAIATAKRLGGVVSATDVRPAAKEQVESLAAKFIAVEDEEFKAAETSGGYAKEMSAEYKAKQAELVATHIAKQDIVVTTALIPGRPAPRLVTAAMIASMRPGSVIVDLATERGGNVEGAKPDAITEINGVKVIGWSNMAGRLAADASALYAKNLINLLGLMTGEEGALALDLEDEIIKAMLLTHNGEVVHPSLTPETAA